MPSRTLQKGHNNEQNQPADPNTGEPRSKPKQQHARRPSWVDPTPSYDTKQVSNECQAEHSKRGDNNEQKQPADPITGGPKTSKDADEARSRLLLATSSGPLKGVYPCETNHENNHMK